MGEEPGGKGARYLGRFFLEPVARLFFAGGGEEACEDEDDDDDDDDEDDEDDDGGEAEPNAGGSGRVEDMRQSCHLKSRGSTSGGRGNEGHNGNDELLFSTHPRGNSTLTPAQLIQDMKRIVFDFSQVGCGEKPMLR